MTIEPLYTTELPYTHIAVIDTGQHVVTYLGWLFKGGFYRAEDTRVVMLKSDAITMQPALSDTARRQLVSFCISRGRIRAEKGRAL